MEAYIRVIFTVCVTAAVIRALAPESSLTKYLQMLCSLCAVAVIALPVYQLLTSTDAVSQLLEGIEVQTEDYEEIYNDFLVNGELENAERVFSEELCRAVSAERGTLFVRLDASYSEGEMQIVGADVLIYSGALTVPPNEIKAYIAQRLALECRIIYM